MRVAVLVAAISALWLANLSADTAEKDPRRDSLFRELSDGIPKDDPRAISARFELDHWHDRHWGNWRPPIREAITTTDGKAAEVVLLNAPAMSMPGSDFSMAFLIVDRKVVDWVSCWTHNRTAKQSLLVEDLNHDGSSDLGFEASEGWFGLKDKRQHRIAGDERTWLYAYTITSNGFRSLFDDQPRERRVKSVLNNMNHMVHLEVHGLPERLFERQWVKCELSVTNTSDKDVSLKPGQWHWLDVQNASGGSFCRPDESVSVLKAGESVSDTIWLQIDRSTCDPSPVFVPVLMRELGNSPRGVSEGGA